MAGGYSRVVTYKGEKDVPVCVRLPLPPRGKLERLAITQIGGSSSTDTITIYDRKGACKGAADLNVRANGDVVSTADKSGKAEFTFKEDHDLLPGDEFEINWNANDDYNVKHVVVSVPDSKKVVTDTDYSSAGAGGIWQTMPFMPTNLPVSHEVYSGSLASGVLKDFAINRNYENSDNQSVTMRTRAQALWLSVTPGGNGTFEVAVTAEPLDIF